MQFAFVHIWKRWTPKFFHSCNLHWENLSIFIIADEQTTPQSGKENTTPRSPPLGVVTGSVIQQSTWLGNVYFTVNSFKPSTCSSIYWDISPWSYRSETEYGNCLFLPNAKAQHLINRCKVNILATETKNFAFKSLDLKQSVTMTCLQIIK